MPRGAPKGVRRGGRAKGTPNKLSQDISAKLLRLKCDPLTGMVKLIHDKDTDASIKARLYIELAQYVYPKRKALDPEDTLTTQQAQMMMQQYFNLFQMVLLRHVTDRNLATTIFSDFAEGMDRLTSQLTQAGAAVEYNGRHGS